MQLINVREYRRGNQIWTIQRNWQHRVHKTKKKETLTTQYVLDTTIRKQTQVPVSISKTVKTHYIFQIWKWKYNFCGFRGEELLNILVRVLIFNYVFCGGSNRNINMMLRMIQASFNILISRKNIRKQHHVWWIKNFSLLQKYVPILAYLNIQTFDNWMRWGQQKSLKLYPCFIAKFEFYSFHWSACTKPGKSAVMYLCVRGHAFVC